MTAAKKPLFQMAGKEGSTELGQSMNLKQVTQASNGGPKVDDKSACCRHCAQQLGCRFGTSCDKVHLDLEDDAVIGSLSLATLRSVKGFIEHPEVKKSLSPTQALLDLFQRKNL